MKKITTLLTIQWLLVCSSHSQNIGIGNTNPAARLDINGDIAIRSADIIITTTYNYSLDVNSARQSNYKLKAPQLPPLGNFVIAGIASGVDGKMITLNNRSGFSMELYNEDAAATAANRIQTGTGSTVAVYNNGNVTLQYDTEIQRWVIKSMHNNSLNYFGGGGGISQWDLLGSNIYNTNNGNVGIGTNLPGRARLEVNGINGSPNTIAIFGGDATGVSIQRNWPTIGFNQYRDDATGYGKAIGNGYGSHVTFNPQFGYVQWVMQDSVAANNSFAVQPKAAITLWKNGFVHVGNSGITDQATLSISGSSGYPSHFNYGTDGHTYIRGGNKIFGGPGVFANRRPSKVYINDQPGEQFSTGSYKPGGDIIMATGGGNVGIGIDNDVPFKLSIYQSNVESNSNTHVLQLRGQNPLMNFADEFNTSRGYIKGVTNNSITQLPSTGLAIGSSDLQDGNGNFGDIYLIAKAYVPAITIKGTTNNVGIGTSTPNEKLSVNGNIRSKEVVVELANWPDYVFEKSYELTPLQEVEDFIKANNHLPNIPSANEIQTNGLKVGDVQKRMMEKIEELTLYMIELKKEIELLKSK